MTTTTPSNATSLPGSVPVGDKASMNKGIAVGALGALVAAAVIGGASWFAFTRGEGIEETNRMGTPTTVIGDSGTAPAQVVAAPNGLPVAPAPAPAPPPALSTASVAPVGQVAQVPAAGGALPAPVYNPSGPPVAQANPAAPVTRPAPPVPSVHPVPAERPVTRVAQGRTGVVSAVHEVNVKGEANGVGAAVGGVLGGLLGHQIGGGNGRTALTVAGAVGGGFAGHEVQKRMNGTKVYNVTVQFDDGSTETLRENSTHGWRSGDRVRVKNGIISSDNA